MILSQNDDMGPSVSMAHFAKNNEQFIKESFKLRRTSSLKHKKKSQWNRQCITTTTTDTLAVKDDDGTIPVQNTEYVDYLTYQWNNFEIINSWKFIKLKRCKFNDIQYNQRLENMSWRIYYRLKLQKCNFITKFDDLIWLYGPLIHRDKSIPNTTINTNSTSSTTLKPILKKRNLRDTLVKGSVWRLKESQNKKQKNSNHNSQDILSQSNCRHIRFNNNVQQCIATVHNSQYNIKRLPSIQLNSNDTDNDSCSSDEDNDTVITQNKSRNFAVSHNVTTQRRYPYIYDYNSVYTDDVTQFLPKDHTCDIIDLPTDINLNLQIMTPSPEFSPLSTPQTPISSTFGNSSFTSSHTDETSSIQTKTRDFITGELISGTDNNFFSQQNSPPPILFNSHKCVTLSNFIFNSSDESDL